LSPSYCTQDGVVPRTRLPEILDFISECGKRHNVRIVNVFHAGDGNIHPILLFDERNAEQVQRVMHASDEILSKCIALGGSVTGEHGIGVEKISFMSQLFTETDLAVMADVRMAFNPQGRCSPQKMLPTAGACGMEFIPQSKPGRRAAL
jgi:glycolate oxidase